jgi:hypothetical protein
VRIEFGVYYLRIMEAGDKERWKLLAEQAAVEQDPEKLVALVEEIDKLLARKQDRLKRLPPDPEK